MQPVITDLPVITKYDSGNNITINYYLLFQFAVVIMITSLILFNQPQFTSFQLLVAVSWVVLSISGFGALFDNRSWAVITECSRLIALPLISILFSHNQNFLVLLSVSSAYALISLAWFYKSYIHRASYTQTGKI